jgi:hypothetical protein
VIVSEPETKAIDLAPTIDLVPQAEILEIVDTPIEADIATEPAGLAAAQVGGAVLIPDAAVAQAEQPSTAAASAQPRARRSRSTRKQKPPTEGG